MNKLRLFAAIFAIIVAPLVVAAQGQDKRKDQKPIKVEKAGDKDKEKDKNKEKTVPAPPALVLVAVAAGAAGLARWRQRPRN